MSHGVIESMRHRRGSVRVSFLCTNHGSLSPPNSFIGRDSNYSPVFQITYILKKKKKKKGLMSPVRTAGELPVCFRISFL